MFLAGDLGGTKVLMGVYGAADDRLDEARKESFKSHEFPTFEVLLKKFTADRSGPPLKSACFGVAGTVVGGHVHATNLPWDLDEAALAGTLGVDRVKLLNDLETTAYGIIALPPEDLVVLNEGVSETKGPANIAVIAAGTGLGEAMLHWDGDHYHPVASEGGHADFAPTDDREVALWRYLHPKFGGHVSYERILSGPGLKNVYDFLREVEGRDEPAWLADEVRADDPGKVISAHGLAGDAPICVEALTLFVRIYGAEAGNLALRSLAIGGVYLGGGIAPKILPALRGPAFLEGFTAKGRYAAYLRGIKISVSLNPEASLIGAAHYAARL